ncbi:hypothetical protein MMC32_004567 [Xylographa parallela]|nr:hypothetical protein [Xylographa parallela]
MESTDKDLLTLIRSLPKELRDMIQREYIRVVMRPGRVYPEDSDSIEKTPRDTLAVYPGIVELLQIQDASMQSLARDILYTQNTWVVAEGPFSTVNFLNQPAIPVITETSRIISIDFSFSCGDSNWILEQFPDHLKKKRQRWRSKLWNSTSKHDMVTAQERYREYEYWQIYTHDNWLDKFRFVSRLPLHHLRLDFRDCYDALGTFHGFKVVSSPSMMIFAFGVPPHLEVVTRDPLTARSLLRHIHQLNWNSAQRVPECSFCVDGLHSNSEQIERSAMNLKAS